MKKCVLGIILCILLTGNSCREKEEIPEHENTEGTSGEITIMCTEAEYPQYQKFIKQTENELNLRITVLAYPENADNRQAKISTILASGEDSVDIFPVIRKVI